MDKHSFNGNYDSKMIDISTNNKTNPFDITSQLEKVDDAEYNLLMGQNTDMIVRGPLTDFLNSCGQVASFLNNLRHGASLNNNKSSMIPDLVTDSPHKRIKLNKSQDSLQILRKLSPICHHLD